MASRPWSLPERQMVLQQPITYEGVTENITVHIKGVVDETVVVERSAAPYSLLPANPGDLQFLHKGRILCPSMSLAFLGVNDGDEIYAVGMPSIPVRAKPKSSPSLSGPSLDRLRERFDAKWATRFRDPDAVFEQLRDSSNPLTAAESARLADLFRTRIETNVSGFRRVCNRFSRLTNGESISRQRTPPTTPVTVVPEKPLCPSTDLLPFCAPSASGGVNE